MYGLADGQRVRPGAVGQTREVRGAPQVVPGVAHDLDLVADGVDPGSRLLHRLQRAVADVRLEATDAVADGHRTRPLARVETRDGRTAVLAQLVAVVALEGEPRAVPVLGDVAARDDVAVREVRRGALDHDALGRGHGESLVLVTYARRGALQLEAAVALEVGRLAELEACREHDDVGGHVAVKDLRLRTHDPLARGVRARPLAAALARQVRAADRLVARAAAESHRVSHVEGGVGVEHLQRAVVWQGGRRARLTLTCRHVGRPPLRRQTRQLVTADQVVPGRARHQDDGLVGVVAGPMLGPHHRHAAVADPRARTRDGRTLGQLLGPGALLAAVHGRLADELEAGLAADADAHAVEEAVGRADDGVRDLGLRTDHAAARGQRVRPGAVGQARHLGPADQPVALLAVELDRHAGDELVDLAHVLLDIVVAGAPHDERVRDVGRRALGAHADGRRARPRLVALTLARAVADERVAVVAAVRDPRLVVVAAHRPDRPVLHAGGRRAADEDAARLRAAPPPRRRARAVRVAVQLVAGLALVAHRVAVLRAGLDELAVVDVLAAAAVPSLAHRLAAREVAVLRTRQLSRFLKQTRRKGSVTNCSSGYRCRCGGPERRAVQNVEG